MATLTKWQEAIFQDRLINLVINGRKWSTYCQCVALLIFQALLQINKVLTVNSDSIYLPLIMAGNKMLNVDAWINLLFIGTFMYDVSIRQAHHLLYFRSNFFVNLESTYPVYNIYALFRSGCFIHHIICVR